MDRGWRPGLYLYNDVGRGYINWSDWSCADNRRVAGAVASIGLDSTRTLVDIDALPASDASLNNLYEYLNGNKNPKVSWITRDEALAIIASARARHALEGG